MKLTIAYLYGDLMNIYGDTGNIIALKKRAEWRGIKVVDKNITIGTKLSKGEADIYFFGGGQDQQQEIVAKDLHKKAKVLKAEIERGIPLLSVCGGYQLLGNYYKPHKGPKLPGVGLFPAYTLASHDRMIGNIVIKSSAISYQLSDKKNESEDRGLTADDYFVGFENHSGKTYLTKRALPFGMVLKGFGNNGEDKSEGCIYMNAIGCYMHGSLLPKNPKLADWLLKKALEVKYGKEFELKPLDDSLENQAHQNVVKRFS